MMNKVQANLVLKMGIALFSTKQSVTEIGISLNEIYTDDDITSGGFWLYNIQTKECYYSDKFLNSLGYNKKDVANNTDFLYKTADVSALEKGFKMINDLIVSRSESSFINYLDYTHKDGSIVKVECCGTVFYKRNEPIIVFGTHILM